MTRRRGLARRLRDDEHPIVEHVAPPSPYVLFVEGDRYLREQVGEALHDAGLAPLLATDAADAAGYMAGASTPVLVVLDLDTPGLDAARLLARFRADARWSRVPVVVTGSGAAAGLQVDGVLPKPFLVEQLVGLARRR